MTLPVTTYGQYQNGTVSVSNNSAVVTGTETIWNSNHVGATVVNAGDIFTIDDSRFYFIQSVDSDTQITLDKPYEGETASDQAYRIIYLAAAHFPADTATKISRTIERYERGAIAKDKFLEIEQNCINAQTAAENAESAAATSASDANSSKVAAEDAKTAAETAKTNAEEAASNAAASASAAQESATQSSNSADAAAASETNAAASATAAANSAASINLDDIIATVKQATLEAVYPVGSIYISITDSRNPSEILGIGTWEALPAGHAIIAQGSATAEDGTELTFTAGQTYGEYKHQLSVGELPSHNHSIYSGYGEGANGEQDAYRYQRWASTSQGWHSTGVHATSNRGGGEYHSLMQKSEAAYVWQRTA